MLKIARILVAAAIICACASEPRPPEEYTTRDSAGVLVVSATAPLHADGEWSVSETPDLVIGANPTDESAQFTNIRQALTLSDETIAVTDVRTYSIRLFDRHGRHIRTIGREGGGPGEFSDDPVLAVADGDTIVAWDAWAPRMSWFDADGSLLRERDMREPLLATGLGRWRGTDWWHLRPDGALLASRIWWSSERIALDTLDYRPIFVGNDGVPIVDYPERIAGYNVYVIRGDGMRVGVPHPHAPKSALALAPRPLTLAVSEPDSWQITLYDDAARPHTIIRLAVPRLPVPSGFSERECEDLRDRERRTGVTAAEMRNALDGVAIPDSLPAIAELIWSRTGELWVARNTGDDDPSVTWDVVAPNGQWLATTRVPVAAGHVLEIGPGSILTASRDELDVPVLKRYRLVRGAG